MIVLKLQNQSRNWDEFVNGEGYSLDLKSKANGESVTVRFVEEWEDCYVLVNSNSAGELFERVVGRVVFSLSKHTAHLMIRSSKPVPTEPTFKSV